MKMYIARNEDGGMFNWTDEMIECKVEDTITTNEQLFELSNISLEKEMEWNLPEGYIFKDENGNVINSQKIVLEKKKKEYPKNYEECCYVIGFENTEMVFEDDYRDINPPKEQWKRLGLINQLNKLLICRDAYWKIAGEEMGLGKPWEPDWTDDMTHKFIIHTIKDKIHCGVSLIKNHTLAFPTAEMRDAFYENFKVLINECKELL